MTYKRFSSLPRNEAISILGQRILNNINATNHIIQYCSDNNFCYRVSSDLFPLITYDKANITLQDLPNYQEIESALNNTKNTITKTGVRVSCHPSEFNVLASINQEAVNKTVKELNFYSWFMDQIGCYTDYRCPINLHVHNKNGSYNEIITRFISNFNRLDPNCQSRLVIENDDKLNCWSVKELINVFNHNTNIPITFDYLHHKCNPDGLEEQEALELCHSTWGSYKPLFHYSESRDDKNPRAHADYAYNEINQYDLDFDLDFELKMKDYAISKHKSIHSTKGLQYV